MYQITKVEAVNRIMQAIDGTIVSSLDQPLNDTVIQAVRAIDTATDKIQIENQWNFNMDGPRTLTADVNDEITIPSDYIFIQFRSWTAGSLWNLTVKDHKVWNRKDATSVVGGSVEIFGSRKFTYDNAPSVIQNLIIEKAKLEFVGANTHLSASRIPLYQAALREAYMAAQKWDSEQKFGAMDLAPPLREYLRDQGGRAGWWWG